MEKIAYLFIISLNNANPFKLYNMMIYTLEKKLYEIVLQVILQLMNLQIWTKLNQYPTRILDLT